MDYPHIFWATLIWMIAWGVVGAIVTPRAFLQKDLTVSGATLTGAFVGAAAGPVGIALLWWLAPRFERVWLPASAVVIVLALCGAFAFSDPDNFCVTSGDFVASQIVNGLVIGVIYSLMAMGLTLIFSILRVVNFAHGEFYMVGGMLTFFFADVWFPHAPAVLAIVAACFATFIIGAVFERLFLAPMHDGRVERPMEYAVLLTFGFSFFLIYLVQALAGASPVKARRFFDFPEMVLPTIDQPWLQINRAGIMLFEAVSISNPRLMAAAVSVLMLLALLFFLYRTWMGKALRAVSQNRQSAAIAGIHPDRINMLAFALGGMLAGLSGAVLVQAFSWVPQSGMLPSLRSFVVVVLGGLGSLSGAFIGGLFVGLVESIGVGCVPDPRRAASYIPAYGMVILTLTLLLRPTGFFGRKE